MKKGAVISSLTGTCVKVLALYRVLESAMVALLALVSLVEPANLVLVGFRIPFQPVFVFHACCLLFHFLNKTVLNFYCYEDCRKNLNKL